MSMHLSPRLGLALPACALALGLTAAPADRFPIGRFASDAYTLTFERTGAFRYQKGDRLMVGGVYVVHDSTISLTDERGSDACLGAARNPGTYRWTRVGRALWFRTLHDPCPDRIRGLADQAWQPHRAR